MQDRRHTIAMTIPIERGLSCPLSLKNEPIMSQQGDINVGKSYLQEVLVLWSSSCNNKSSAQLQTTISRVRKTLCQKENAARHMHTQLQLKQIAVQNTSMWATRLTLAVCTTHVPTPEDPACTRTRLPDLMFQSDIACTQASDHLLGSPV
jgi:hypothetical protein